MIKSSTMKARTMRRLLPVLAALTFASAGAHAGVISGTSSDGAGKDLQSLFDGWVGPGYDVESKHQTPGYWSIGASGISAATLIIEIAGNANDNKFGLFDRYNPDNRLQVYDGSSSTGTRRTINYFAGSDLFMVVDNTSPETAGYVGSAAFASAHFGFYLEGPGGTFFSAPALNDEHVQMVAFKGEGQWSDFVQPAEWLTDEWVLAWEDLPYANSDQDFNDLVLIMESITPVPEPGTITLLGLGLLGLIALRRREA